MKLYASLYLAYIAFVVHPDLNLAATMLCLAAPYALVVLLEIGHVGVAALRNAILRLAFREAVGAFGGAAVSLAFDVVAVAGLWLWSVVVAGGATVAFGGFGRFGV